MHCTSDSEINGGIIILFPFCSPNFPISSSLPVTHPSPIISFTGKKLEFTIDSGGFHNTSSERGQEMVAEEALEKAARHGHWVLLKQPPWWGLSPQLKGYSQNKNKICGRLQQKF